MNEVEQNNRDDQRQDETQIGLRRAPLRPCFIGV